MRRRVTIPPVSALPDDPLWYKDAIIYEVHVRSFHDSNGDGIGDFHGLTEKLDYLRDLGITALWLLPFYPSPLRDGGYDIADYDAIHPDYGTLDDFVRFLEEAHRRGLRVITELVLNHTSADHAWFQRARRAPAGSPERDFYVWSDSPDRYRGARIIFQDFEQSNWAWDPVARAYYWHRFYSHQPDLNFDNPAVADALLSVVDHWFELGVDGMRLDAIPYLFEREETNSENLPETHAFLKRLRAHVDSRFRNRMLLAEANQWPIDAASYFGDGDECHMSFHFPLMPRLFIAVQLEDAYPIIDILDQTPPIPPVCQWATFLRNHDELTLEMVTEEDRDYMYRVYAQDRRARVNLGIRRRLAPLLGGRRRLELLNSLLFSLPGTPVLYYGDEIGMGDNIYLGDRDGVRTPMQWSSDRNAGFSRANPQRLYLPIILDPEYHYEAVNVEAQQSNPSSILWWTKRLIALRKEHPVFGRGSFEIIDSDNNKVFAYARALGAETVICVANLSRFVQHASLDLGRFRGADPIEAFGRSRFPRIGPDRYGVSLGPHGFYWFFLEPELRLSASGGHSERPLRARGRWYRPVDQGEAREAARQMSSWAAQRRWYRSKAKAATRPSLRDAIVIDDGPRSYVLALLAIDHTDGPSELYVLPLLFIAGDTETPPKDVPEQSVVARVAVLDPEPGEASSGWLVDAFATAEFARRLLTAMVASEHFDGLAGTLRFELLPEASSVLAGGSLEPRPAVELDQTNSVVFLGTQAVFKLLRAIDEGPNAEDELTRFLSRARESGPGHTPRRIAPAALGVVDYVVPGHEPALVGLLSELVANRGTGWDVALDAAQGFLDRALMQRDVAPPAPVPLLPPEPAPLHEILVSLVAHFGPLVELLARRTAELHQALASSPTDPAFAPEPFTELYQQSIFQNARTLLGRTTGSLRRRMRDLPSDLGPAVEAFLASEDAIEERLRDVTSTRLRLSRIRVHGDFHLGQVLFTGDDFVIMDFEGEPMRTIRERRLKRCPLRDVAGMVRSLDYAIRTTLRSGRHRGVDAETLALWARAWATGMASVYVETYLAHVRGECFVPESRSVAARLLRFYLLEKCIYEIGYEAQNRPDRLDVPLAGLAALLAVDSSP